MFTITPKSLETLWGIFEESVTNSHAVLSNKMVYDQVAPSHIVNSGKVVDYARFRAFELVAQEIKANNISGSMAEAGVCKGAFAQIINIVFPERKLHLFDTFEGFSKKQIEAEYSNSLIDEFFTQDKLFADTSVEIVMGNMVCPQNVIIHKGLFEETSKNVDDTYAFVSLDMDLYEPMLAGLEYFYPRMRGGYMFLHDYNHAKIRGVKLAVQEYEKLHKCHLRKMPLPDEGGTVVILC